LFCVRELSLAHCRKIEEKVTQGQERIPSAALAELTTAANRFGGHGNWFGPRRDVAQ
jgi:hypothetical protein